MKILVAEDNRVNQKLARKILESWGHSVTIVETGSEAVELSETASFDVILMDIEMPKMTGDVAARKIREREATSGMHIPIIAFTANVLSEQREEFVIAGIDDFVGKPINRNELLRALRGTGRKTVTNGETPS
jgi:CheY-like chemotaxis protein